MCTRSENARARECTAGETLGLGPGTGGSCNGSSDVVLIPAHGWVRLRIPFTTYSGRSVYHCPILDQEDAGMMATVNVRG